MGYSSEVLRKAGAVMVSRRSNAVRTAEERAFSARKKIPALADMEKELSSMAIKAAMLALNGMEAETGQIQVLKKNSLDLQQKIREALIAEGLPGNYLDVTYTCSHCEDTGYVGQQVCGCLEALRRQTAYEMLSEQAPAGNYAFNTFSLDYYSNTVDETGRIPRRGMERIFARCKEYAAGFHRHAESLLFCGNTGLGKTHLSLAIAKEVLEQGYGVLYISAYRYVELAERYKFQHDAFPVDIAAASQECDLLILDDLGTEFSTNFSVAALQSLLNQRLSANLPTIVSTNLNVALLEERYGERLKSRLTCAYVPMLFLGKDIRFEKRRLQA